MGASAQNSDLFEVYMSFYSVMLILLYLISKGIL